MTKTLTIAALAVALLAPSGPGFAATAKETDCAHQAAIVTAVRQARLNRVREQKVSESVLAGNVSWPERYNAAIPIFAAEIYKLRLRDVRQTDIGAQWRAACLAN